VKWTEEQEQVIRLRDQDLLVSAAAGSGKTAVLVERILSLVTDPVRPTDIDRLLVVTFTRAAAGEMRERIGRAIEERLAQEPDNEHLQRQGILLEHAQISTIDGFCTHVIRNYFHTIDLDPGFRIADEGELRLMRGDVLKEVLEEEYAEGREAFLDFVDAFAPGKNDRMLEEILLQVYGFAVSDPWPEEWLDSCRKACAPETEDELAETGWFQLAAQEAGKILRGLEKTAERNLELAERPDGPAAYKAVLEKDLELLRSFRSCRTYGDWHSALEHAEPARLPGGKKAKEEDPEIRKQIRDSREELKKKLSALNQDWFGGSPEEILKELEVCRPHMDELIRLTIRFMEAFSARKREKNILDFSDLEHFALKILLEKTPDGLRRTVAARELAEQYTEIMTDEYQDSNYIQEYLLEAVSGTEKEIHNRFMVGDIKQSIYGFRQARPELFLEKYMAFAGGREHSRRIDLSRNFRSRTQVLDTVNFLFRRLMSPDLGGPEYDDAAALHAEAAFSPGRTEGEYDTEFLLLDSKTPELEGEKDRTVLMELEAMAVAREIRRLMETLQVEDRESGGQRPLRYRDCVILLRSAGRWADTFARVLREEGIPAHATSKEGYFSAVEVVTVLNYLRICDNPRQDIPLAAVLRSPIVGCGDRELAEIRCFRPDAVFWDAVTAYAREGKNGKLREKLESFLNLLEQIRLRVSDTPVHQIIRLILDGTGYGAYAAAMPGGEQRKANLEMLVEKAVEFEHTSYRGMFHFIRYMERLEQYRVDFGEVNFWGETADAVRIMTIHKSKGLEFPVVFVSGLGNRFNFQDLNRPVILHASMGIGMNAVDTGKRIRKTSLMKQAVRQAVKRDMLGEELRVLYVALTRAREKLILTAVTDVEKRTAVCRLMKSVWKDKIPYSQLISASGCLDWIFPALSGTSCLQPLFRMENGADADEPSAEQEKAQDVPVRIRVVTPSQLAAEQLALQAERGITLEQLKATEDRTYDAEIRDFLDEKEAYRYPYARLADIPAKMTVSELKQPGLADEEEEGVRMYAEPEIVPYIPAFMKEDEKAQAEGAARGTAYHRVLECLDYSAVSEGELQEQLENMVRDGKLDRLSADCVELKDLQRFLQTGLGKRMEKAAEQGRLWREQPFSLAVPAGEIDPGWQDGQAEDTVLVQGVIDAFFEEDGEYVIVDYKTDRVFTTDGSDLAEKYGKQLYYYRKALEQASGRPVREMLIYSVTLGRAIPVDRREAP
jgi:ATP-dependent helicase/nuclease subunit A